ncbi:hypothetical protein AbraIFM66950_001487 [Aspergillus brasiliensis]|nr:hypothetical protein AbraIFM66950_001487 [Aspergillus brasiliensis]
MSENVGRERVLALYALVTDTIDKLMKLTEPRQSSQPIASPEPFVSSDPDSIGDVLQSFLNKHGISLSDWDIEESSSIPFTPLPLSVLRDHPPNQELPFPTYIPPTSEMESEANEWHVNEEENCGHNAANFLYQLAVANRDVGRDISCLERLSGVRIITYPNPFLVYDVQNGWCPFTGGDWEATFLLEPEPNTSQLPHIAVVADQPAGARDGSILCGELAVIVSVMHSRVMQPKAESEEEMKSLFDMNGVEIEKLSQESPAFPSEQRFPVLLFSFVGPQHARIICASMVGDLLVAQISRLYSFEREEEAPLDLFLSWLFARPAASSEELAPHRGAGV